MAAIPVILIFDVGKTNKKVLLFNEHYELVFEESIRLKEVHDEDGFPAEDIHALGSWVKSSLERILSKSEYNVKAINFSAYGASLVYIDEQGNPIPPLYNYLKPYPDKLLSRFYADYGGRKEFSRITASPGLGSLNSGLQLYRMKYEKPEVFTRIRYALHLPQYLSYLITKTPVSEITSIGCHTGLWDFQANAYHEWVNREQVASKFPLIYTAAYCSKVNLSGKEVKVGVGLHDSSAALIPYLSAFREPFVLLSTGTWCISLNPFNNTTLTSQELEKDCLCYLTAQAQPVKASRLFAGYEHEQQAKRLAEYYKLPVEYFNNLNFDLASFRRLKFKRGNDELDESLLFNENRINEVQVDEAYHDLVIDIVARQLVSTKLILPETRIKRLFVDGGFSKNSIYMHLMAAVFPGLEVFAASVPQASALGAALSIHRSWNSKALPTDLIGLKHYSDALPISDDK